MHNGALLEVCNIQQSIEYNHSIHILKIQNYSSTTKCCNYAVYLDELV